jgi:hypothetical protein
VSQKWYGVTTAVQHFVAVLRSKRDLRFKHNSDVGMQALMRQQP